MKTKWTAGLDANKSKELVEDFKASGVLRERLAAILQEKIDSNKREVTKKDAYAIANWAYLQADAVGYERALNEVISLILSKND